MRLKLYMYTVYRPISHYDAHRNRKASRNINLISWLKSGLKQAVLFLDSNVKWKGTQNNVNNFIWKKKCDFYFGFLLEEKNHLRTNWYHHFFFNSEYNAHHFFLIIWCWFSIYKPKIFKKSTVHPIMIQIE